MFRRRRSDGEPDDDGFAPEDAELQDEDLDDEVDDVDEVDDPEDLEGFDDDDEDDEGEESPAAALTPRDDGPFDIGEISDDLDRLDLGALQVLPPATVEVRLEIDEASGVVQAVTLVSGDTAMQVGVFAAPRTEGIWEEVRTQIAASITSGGGTVDHTEGEFGPELRAKVVAQDADGKRVTQAVRFIGVDGPRWFLRGLLSGAIDDRAATAELMGVFRTLVVVRGNDPMAPHEPLTITLPQQPGEENQVVEQRPDLNPFRRGPEITEIR